jgi:hypothetical protein
MSAIWWKKAVAPSTGNRASDCGNIGDVQGNRTNVGNFNSVPGDLSPLTTLSGRDRLKRSVSEVIPLH